MNYTIEYNIRSSALMNTSETKLYSRPTLYSAPQLLQTFVCSYLGFHEEMLPPFEQANSVSEDSSTLECLRFNLREANQGGVHRFYGA